MSDSGVIQQRDITEKPVSFFLETYGCQMNVNDSEILTAFLHNYQYQQADHPEEADLILINTCAVRENAEQRVFGRIDHYKQYRKRKPGLIIGIMGCMAERLQNDLLAKGVDLVVGPDAYRNIGPLLEQLTDGSSAMNTELSREETYEDVIPVRMDKNGISAYVSIMRGCDNYCAYCVVPYTRGRERSRDPASILREVDYLIEQGYKEVTLLGQNVNSYNWDQDGKVVDFPHLLEQVAKRSSEMRVRFATSHPKDMSDALLKVMAGYPNICRHIHLPCQSGSTKVLQRMNRKYSREWYLNRIQAIKEWLPDCSITTDILAGFSGETAADHQETLSLVKQVAFDSAFTFRYSVRPGTLAAKKYSDDVPEQTKISRLNEIIALQQEISETNNQKIHGSIVRVLIEGRSKKSDQQYAGRTSQNKRVVFPKTQHQPGDYIDLKINGSTAATLFGNPL